MQACFATRLGPGSFAKVMSEMAHLRHGDEEHYYIAKLQTPNISLDDRKPFSAFADKSRYAGTVPSSTYLADIFVDHLTSTQAFYDRITASWSAANTKGDHTFNVSHLRISDKH